MKIKIKSKDLLTIAGEIQRNCDLLFYTDGADTDNDVFMYATEILRFADELQALVTLKKEQQKKK